MHILLYVVLPVFLGLFIGLRIIWRLLVGKPVRKKLVAPEVFKPTHGFKGPDGIYQLSEAQYERLTNAAKNGLMFVIHQVKEDDEPKVKEALEDQALSFADLEAQGIVREVPEDQQNVEIKQHIKDLNRPIRVLRLTDQAYKMFINVDRKAN